MNCCTDEYLHTSYPFHYHYAAACGLICTENHAKHLNGCYSCGIKEQNHYSNKKCTYVDDEGVQRYFTRRIDVATQLIENMTEALPEGTRIGRVVFNNDTDTSAEIVSSFDGVIATGYTFLMRGVRLALDTERADACFTNDPTTQKVLIILTNGAATDNDYGEGDEAFDKFKADGGVVYTIGFFHEDGLLEDMTANGGTYSTASNPDELEIVFDHITMELTAMLIDPMGNKVGFVTNSVNNPDTSVEGTTTYDSDSGTLYWNPAQSADITNSKIEYSIFIRIPEQCAGLTVK